MRQVGWRGVGRLAIPAVVLVLTPTFLAGVAAADDLLKHFRSVPRDIQPATPGLTVHVIGGDKELQLRNQSGRTVVVEGYDREPYLRFTPNGAVERNQHSPATYLNADRQGLRKVPPEANPAAKPQWRTISTTGSYRWFDHRIHIISPQGPPPQAKGRDKPTKVLSWTVPLTIDGKRAAIHGALFWDPRILSSGFPFATVAAIVAALVVLVSIVLVQLRRRRPARGEPRKETPEREAW